MLHGEQITIYTIVPSCVGPIPPLVMTKSYVRTMRLLASTLRPVIQRLRRIQRSSELPQILTCLAPRQESLQRVA